MELPIGTLVEYDNILYGKIIGFEEYKERRLQFPEGQREEFAEDDNAVYLELERPLLPRTACSQYQILEPDDVRKYVRVVDDVSKEKEKVEARLEARLEEDRSTLSFLQSA